MILGREDCNGAWGAYAGLHLNCGQQNVVYREGVKGGVCSHKSVVRLCIKGCHLE
jgi:hypothetical protein